MTTTPTLDQLAQQVAALQRNQTPLDAIPHAQDHFEAVAQRQSQQFLIRRQRAQRGHEARQRTEAKLAGKRHKIEHTLANVNRERIAALERHDQHRRDIAQHFTELAEPPLAALAVIQGQVNQAAADAEALPVDIPLPKISLGIDRSDTIRDIPKRGWR